MFQNPLLNLLRGLLAIGIIVGGVLLIREAFDELPRERSVMAGDQLTVVPLRSLAERFEAWNPGSDRRPIGLFASGLLLLLLSVGGRLVSPRLWRKPGGAGAPTASARRQKIATRAGHAIAIEEFGLTEGAPLVLVHGLGCDRTIWREVIADLEDAFRILAVDLPGHGQSARRQGPHTIEDMSDDLDDVIRLCGTDGLVLAGHSMGGMIAMTWVLEHPEEAPNMAGLVIVHSTPRNPYRTMDPVPLHRLLQKPVYEPLLRLTPPLAPLVRLQQRLEYWNGSIHWQSALTSFGGSETREQLDRVAQLQATLDPVVNARLALDATTFDVREALGEIHLPTRVVVADRDPITRPAAGRDIARSIPGAELVTLARTRHMGLMERSPEVAEAIRRLHVAPAEAEARRGQGGTR